MHHAATTRYILNSASQTIIADGVRIAAVSSRRLNLSPVYNGQTNNTTDCSTLCDRRIPNRAFRLSLNS